MSILKEFLDFFDTLEEPAADLEPTEKSGLLKEMFGERASEFEVFAQHGSGSLMAYWNIEGKRPIIWADTGWSAGVIAGSEEDFLRLLPFDTGFIYDLVFYSKSPEEAAAALEQSVENNPDQPKIVAWLKERGLEIPSNPAEIVDAAKAALPDPSGLIQ